MQAYRRTKECINVRGHSKWYFDNTYDVERIKPRGNRQKEEKTGLQLSCDNLIPSSRRGFSNKANPQVA